VALKIPTITIPIIAYSICFGFANILMAIVIPQLMGEKFNLNAQKIGLQFGGMIIGLVISVVSQ
jgi:hypothetical protein